MECRNLNIPTDLIRCIMALIPLKPRTRLKLVSKDWCGMITEIRESTPITSPYGLVIGVAIQDSNVYEWSPCINEANFIRVQLQDHGKEIILLDSLKPSFPDMKLVGSCNGLLLFAKGSHDPDHYKLMVYSPIMNQSVSVPIPKGYLDVSTICFFYDEYEKHFKIMCLTWVHGVSEIELSIGTNIFSSKTWEWCDYMENTSFPYDLMGILKQCSRICFDGKICFVTDNDRLNVFDVWKNTSDYVVDPHIRGTIGFPWLMEGKLWCCYRLKKMVGIYALQDDGTWKCTDNIHHQEFHNAVEQIPDSSNPYKRIFYAHLRLDAFNLSIRLDAFNFNEDLQTLYFAYFRTVFGYSFETKKLTVVWVGDYHLRYMWLKGFSFLSKPVDISHFQNRLPFMNESRVEDSTEQI